MVGVSARESEKPAGVATRVRSHDPVGAFARVLKEARCRYSADFQSLDFVHVSHW